MAWGHAPSPTATSKQHLRHAHTIVDTLNNLVRFTPCAKQQAATRQTWCKVPPAHSEPQSLALLHVATHGSYTSKTAFFVAAMSTQPCQRYCQPFKYTTRCLSNYTPSYRQPKLLLYICTVRRAQHCWVTLQACQKDLPASLCTLQHTQTAVSSKAFSPPCKTQPTKMPSQHQTGVWCKCLKLAGVHKANVKHTLDL